MDTPIPEFLAEAANRRVSDIFIIAGRPLAEKIDGHLLDRGDRLMPDQTENLLRTIYGLAENRDISRLMETGDDDFSFSIPGVSRFRVNAYKQRGSLAAVIRVIAFRLPDPAELSIPEDVMNISEYTRGMVLVTGSAGSGKSTTMACLIDRSTIPGKATSSLWRILWNISTAMIAVSSASARSVPTPKAI